MGIFGGGRKEEGTASEPDPIREVRDEVELLEAIEAGPTVIYKHSNRCGICFRTLKEMRTFAGCHPEVPVYMIDVVRDRALSNLVAERLGVRHESPQAIVVRDGVAVWDGSHLNVTAGGVSTAFA